MAIIVTQLNTSLNQKNSKSSYFNKETNSNKSYSNSWLESDKITLSLRKQESVCTILTHQVVASLNKSFDEHQITLDDLFPQDSNPKTTANRILTYIEKLLSKNLSRTMSSMEGEKLFESIKNSFEDGFIDSSKYMSSLGLLNEKTSEELNSTYRIVRIGIEKLHLKNSQLVTLENNLSAADFNKLKTNEAFQFDLNTGQSVFVIVNNLIARQTSEAYTIHTQLPVELIPIIDETIKKIDKLAANFIKDNTLSALNNIKHLGYQPDQLAGFTMKNYKTHSVKAISTYNKLNPETNRSLHNSDLENIIGFIQDLNAIILNTNTQQYIKHPEESIPEFFRCVLKGQINETTDVKAATPSFSLLDSLMNALSLSIKNIT